MQSHDSVWTMCVCVCTRVYRVCVHFMSTILQQFKQAIAVGEKYFSGLT